MANREEPCVDYGVSHKYLVHMDRLQFRDAQPFLEAMVDRFNLPKLVKQEAVLVKEE